MAARIFVTKDGKLHTDDPKVKEAVIKAMIYPTTAYKEGFIPPSAVKTGTTPTTNNAFHAKTIVMDLDGTISTEVACCRRQEGGFTTISSRWAWRSATRETGAEPSVERLRPRFEGGKERRGRQGFPQIFLPAQGQQRALENRPRPQHSVHAVNCQDDPWWSPTRTARPMSTGQGDLTTVRFEPECSSCRSKPQNESRVWPKVPAVLEQPPLL